MKLRADFEMTCFTYEGIDALKEALITSRTKVNSRDPDIQISFKLIAPPNYRCETITLKKNEGLALLDEALKEVERVIKGKGGTYKLASKPQIIGDSAKDKDIEEIMRMPGEREGSDEDSSGAEDNEEGMGDIDLGEDGEEGKQEGGDDDEDVDEDGEERKVSKTKKAKKSKKSKKDSDDEDDDQ
jgi:translation initiation factor 2 subunit 1